MYIYTNTNDVVSFGKYTNFCSKLKDDERFNYSIKQFGWIRHSFSVKFHVGLVRNLYKKQKMRLGNLLGARRVENSIKDMPEEWKLKNKYSLIKHREIYSCLNGFAELQ